MRAGLVLLASVFLLASCASLPQAPVGPLPENASQSIREYKLRKHRVALDQPLYLAGVGFKVSQEPMDLKGLESYFRNQGESPLAAETAVIRRKYRQGIVWSYVGAVGLAPVTFGFSLMFLPMVTLAMVENRARKAIAPVVKTYNESLETRYFAPTIPLSPALGVEP